MKKGELQPEMIQAKVTAAIRKKRGSARGKPVVALTIKDGVRVLSWEGFRPSEISAILGISKQWVAACRREIRPERRRRPEDAATAVASVKDSEPTKTTNSRELTAARREQLAVAKEWHEEGEGQHHAAAIDVRLQTRGRRQWTEVEWAEFHDLVLQDMLSEMMKADAREGWSKSLREPAASQ